MEFPNSSIPEEDKLFLDKPQTWVPIEVDNSKYENYHCTSIITHLQVCNAIEIHQSQGIGIGPEKEWEKVFITIQGKHISSQPGMELVDFYMATSEESLAIHAEDVNGVSH